MARQGLPPEQHVVAGKPSLPVRLLRAVPLTLCLVVIVLGLVTALYLEPSPTPKSAPLPATPATMPSPGLPEEVPAPPAADNAELPTIEPLAGTSPSAPVPEASAAPLAAAPCAGERYWVEYGVYATPRYARRLRQALTRRGIETVIVTTHRPDGRALRRVRSTAPLDLSAAKAAARDAAYAVKITPLLHRVRRGGRKQRCWTGGDDWGNDGLAMMLTPIDRDRLPGAFAHLAANLDDAWARSVFERIARIDGAERAAGRRAAAHHDDAVALLAGLGLGLRPGSPSEDFSWDGHAARSATEAYVLLHEAAHFQLAAPERRRRIDFGLGPGPETGNRRAAADAACLFGLAREREEAMASLLGILWEVELGHPALASFLDQNWLEGAERPGTAAHLRSVLEALRDGGFITGDGRPTRFLRAAPDAL